MEELTTMSSLPWWGKAIRRWSQTNVADKIFQRYIDMCFSSLRTWFVGLTRACCNWDWKMFSVWLPGITAIVLAFWIGLWFVYTCLYTQKWVRLSSFCYIIILPECVIIYSLLVSKLSTRAFVIYRLDFILSLSELWASLTSIFFFLLFIYFLRNVYLVLQCKGPWTICVTHVPY